MEKKGTSSNFQEQAGSTELLHQLQWNYTDQSRNEDIGKRLRRTAKVNDERFGFMSEWSMHDGRNIHLDDIDEVEGRARAAALCVYRLRNGI